MNGLGIDVRGVSKGYTGGLTALSDVDLEVRAGEMLALMGPSGSGKSTLLHVLGGMERADAGCVRVGEAEVTQLAGASLARYRRSIGFVFQRFHLLPALTVLDNVLAPVLPLRTAFDKRRRARALLEEVGLADRESSMPALLSGGEQQRVAVARALINEPGLLLADEPTGNLDSVTGTEVLKLLARLQQERSMTVLVATHDPGVARSSDRVVTIRDGRLIGDD